MFKKSIIIFIFLLNISYINISFAVTLKDYNNQEIKKSADICKDKGNNSSECNISRIVRNKNLKNAKENIKKINDVEKKAAITKAEAEVQADKVKVAEAIKDAEAKVAKENKEFNKEWDESERQDKQEEAQAQAKSTIKDKNASAAEKAVAQQTLYNLNEGKKLSEAQKKYSDAKKQVDVSIVNSDNADTKVENLTDVLNQLTKGTDAYNSVEQKLKKAKTEATEAEKAVTKAKTEATKAKTEATEVEKVAKTAKSKVTAAQKVAKKARDDACKKSKSCIDKANFVINVDSISPGRDHIKGNTKETINFALGTIIQKLMIGLGSLSLLIMTVGAGYIVLHNGQDELLNKGKSIFMSGIYAMIVALSSYYLIVIVRYILYA